jgi:hypothetical protein
MKKIFLFCLIAAVVSACKSNGRNTPGTAGDDKTLTAEEKQQAISDSANFTSIRWLDSTTKNLGKLVKDQTIEISFRFKNSGTKTLIIEDVSAPCGCTIPEKPEKPIAPGEEGIIKAKYNGSGHGTISKQIYLKANTTPTTDHTLTFTGEIQEQ